MECFNASAVLDLVTAAKTTGDDGGAVGATANSGEEMPLLVSPVFSPIRASRDSKPFRLAKKGVYVILSRF